MVADGIGFVAYLFDRVLPYLLWSIGDAVTNVVVWRLGLAIAALLGAIKAVELVVQALRRLWQRCWLLWLVPLF